MSVLMGGMLRGEYSETAARLCVSEKGKRLWSLEQVGRQTPQLSQCSPGKLSARDPVIRQKKAVNLLRKVA